MALTALYVLALFETWHILTVFCTLVGFMMLFKCLCLAVCRQKYCSQDFLKELYKCNVQKDRIGVTFVNIVV